MEQYIDHLVERQEVAEGNNSPLVLIPNLEKKKNPLK